MSANEHHDMNTIQRLRKWANDEEATLAFWVGYATGAATILGLVLLLR